MEMFEEQVSELTKKCFSLEQRNIFLSSQNQHLSSEINTYKTDYFYYKNETRAVKSKFRLIEYQNLELKSMIDHETIKY
jgi:hypothetical protein